jgi:hypothetical protein
MALVPEGRGRGKRCDDKRVERKKKQVVPKDKQEFRKSRR